MQYVLLLNSFQVHLLFKRAFDDPNGRTFCLGGPETLEPKVSNEALMHFNSLEKNKKSNDIHNPDPLHL